MFIKLEIMKNAASLVQLLKIWIDQSSNLVKSSMVIFGFATEGIMQVLLCEDDKETF